MHTCARVLVCARVRTDFILAGIHARKHSLFQSLISLSTHLFVTQIVRSPKVRSVLTNAQMFELIQACAIFGRGSNDL